MIEFENVSRETKLNLETYVDTLLRWNQKINLIGKSTQDNIWERHIADCLRLESFMEKDKKIVDLGSGAGLPGLLMSITGFLDVTLIESDLKKTAFLKYIVGLLNLKTKIIEDRIEKHLDIEYDYLTARAFAPLKDILGFAHLLLHKNGKAILLKGSKYREEIADAHEKYDFQIEVAQDSNTLFGPILIISNIEPKFA